jgi:hypothetical protein
VCRTNLVGFSREVKCDTQRIPGTNIVVCFTNTIPPSTFIRCATNLAGDILCVTNFFPGTNRVFCHTIELPDTIRIICRTNINPGSNVVTCFTNRIINYSNVVTCVTKTVPCSEIAPCINALRIRFGPIITSLDYDGNGTNGDQIFVITSGSAGTVKPSSVEQNDGVITLRFSPALCAGDSSVFIGLVSSNAPADAKALLGLTSGSSLVVAVRAPRRPPINCDFRSLFLAISSLTSNDFSAPNDRAASGRRSALLKNVNAASAAAQQGDLEGVLEGIEMVSNKVSGQGLDWLTPDAASRLRTALLDLLNCLQQFNNGEHNDGEHDDE